MVEGWHGRRYGRPLGRTREVIELSRRIWRREVIEHRGITELPLSPEKGGTLGKPLKLLNHPVRDTIPVYLAALGPASVKMAAELADGWLPFLCVPERAAEVWGRSLAEGAAARDPALGRGGRPAASPAARRTRRPPYRRGCWSSSAWPAPRGTYATGSRPSARRA